MREFLRAALKARAKIVADGVASLALRSPRLERAIARGCRRPILRRLGLGAVAIGYMRLLRRRELRVAELGSYRFWVNVAEPLGIEPYFFGRPGASWLASDLIRPGDCCIDAGANVGHYTFLSASLVGARGRVLAVEANPEFVDLLKRSIALNENSSSVEVVPFALWSEAGTQMTFFLSVDPSNSGASSLIDHGQSLSPEHTVRVLTTTLDVLATERGLDHLRLVKIDVERCEDRVLRGAERLLSAKKIDFLIVELLIGSEAVAILERHGYSGYMLDATTRQLVPVAHVPQDTFCDVLFVSPRVEREFGEKFSRIMRA